MFCPDRERSSVFELFDGLATEMSDGVWRVHSFWDGKDEERWITKNHISCEYERKTPYDGCVDDVCWYQNWLFMITFPQVERVRFFLEYESEWFCRTNYQRHIFNKKMTHLRILTLHFIYCSSVNYYFLSVIELCVMFVI